MITHVALDIDGVVLAGDLGVPEDPQGLVLFAHGSGSSRRSPRNRAVAAHLRDAGLATLLFDLLTETESLDRANVFDIALLAGRLVGATRWVADDADVGSLPVGYFGASTGAAAALVAAAKFGDTIGAVVSRGGRPDLAGDALQAVRAPTLLLVGGADDQVLALNRAALQKLGGPKELIVIPGATHLFEEPGALEDVAEHAAGWFRRYLAPHHATTGGSIRP
ncbi:MAG TPA: dienelactone hydrolase family protein [Gemmatimonadales bacterium]|nr:dienelactone hydrolase family protein [Gemmatimonadales bacterium]